MTTEAKKTIIYIRVEALCGGAMLAKLVTVSVHGPETSGTTSALLILSFATESLLEHACLPCTASALDCVNMCATVSCLYEQVRAVGWSYFKGLTLLSTAQWFEPLMHSFSVNFIVHQR